MSGKPPGRGRGARVASRRTGGAGSAADALPLAGLRRGLLEWYAEAARELPWRVREGAPDPYAVWLSEVMLQQTRVAAVAPYFTRWMERLPTLEALAAAEQEEVLKLWEGLGYYSRARNLHRAAREAAARHGEVPADPESFGALPGVGPYTRGAVASIAFGRREPAVDGNARRVLSRWLNEERPLPARLAQVARELVREGPPGEINQALMELGATLCTPRAPACGRCPVETLCGGRAAGRERELPAPRPRAAPRPEVAGVAVIRRGGQLLVVRIPEAERLGGTWGPPHAACGPGEGAADAALRAAAPWVHGARAGRPLPPVEHTFTHVRTRYLPVPITARAARDGPPGARWVDAAQLAELPLSSAMRKVVRSLTRPAA